MAWSAERLQVLVAVVSERPAAVQMMNVEAGGSQPAALQTGCRFRYLSAIRYQRWS
jgi:hypothetical protein